jgi:hypothetical protein
MHTENSLILFNEYSNTGYQINTPLLTIAYY